MKKLLLLALISTVSLIGYSHYNNYSTKLTRVELSCKSDWGFFGHRRINRMAVFTLPQNMLGFYKRHIEFVTEHAVDPDKRRYASKHEAVRHYIDLDHWGKAPFENVPRKWNDVILQFCDLYVVSNQGDTLLLIGYADIKDRDAKPLLETGGEFLKLKDGGETSLSTKDYKRFFKQNIMRQYYDDEWTLACDSLQSLISGTGLKVDCNNVFAKDQFSGYGVLPYHLLNYYYRLKKAFEIKDVERILRLSADYGHYIGDAHVPLHTTENYNGQMTNQVGIHAFWESRVPELFADKEYDYFVGPAKYIDDKGAYFWDIVLTSHSYVDSVLLIEKELSKTFPEDKQFCFDNRNDRTTRTQCEEYVRAYSNRLDGMVESRMRDAIYSIGCIWYSAWVDAGQPKINELDLFKPNEAFLKNLAEEKASYDSGEIKGRKH